MRIEIRLFASLRRGRFEAETREFPPGTTAKTIVDDLGISEGEATLVFINGRHANLEAELKSNDVLALFPPIGGG